MFQNLDGLDPAEASYRLLKAERNARRFGLFVKLALIGAVWYGYHFYSLPENALAKQALIEKGQTKFEELLLPVVESTVTRMTAKIQADMVSGAKTTKAAGSGTAGATIDPRTLSPQALQMLCSGIQKK